jgi:hypothetical protein
MGTVIPRFTRGVLLAAVACVCAPAAAVAGNEAAPWSAPTWLDGGENTGVSASGPSLTELPSGALVATWNEDLAGSTFPQMASEPFAGSWSAPDSLSTTPMEIPQDGLGGVRTAIDGQGGFVSAWQTPDAVAGQDDIVGVSGTVTPGEAPTFTPHTFGTYSNDARDGLSFEYPYTPQVAMSTDGTGSAEFTAVDNNASPGTDKRLAAIENGSIDTLTTNPPIRDNPVDGSSNYDKYIPQLAVAGLNAEWTASTNDTEAMIATSNNYDTHYGSQDAPDENAILYTTSNPLDWYSVTPTVLPMTGELAAAGVLPNNNVIVANDADDPSNPSSPYQLSVWETGAATAKVLDSDTGDPAGYPAVATFNDGSATIAYIDYDGSDGTGVVKETTMSPNGQWSDPVPLSPAGFKVHDVTDAYGPDGTTYVAWDATSTTDAADDGIYSSVRLPGGSFPSTPEPVYTATNDQGGTPKIVVDETGFATIVATAFDSGVGTRVAAFTHTNPIPPRLDTAPSITGAAKVGSTLACAGDAWFNRPTSFLVQWLRGTASIAGATARTYTATSADGGQTLSCEVTATNAYGSALGKSAGVKVAAAANSQQSNVSPTAGSVGTTGGNAVSVTISCPATAQSCAPAVLTITVVEKLIGGKVVAVIASKHAKKKKTVVIGRAKESLRPGQKKKVTVHLNGAGKKLIAHRARLRVAFTVTAGGKRVLGKTLTLHKPKPHGVHHRG